MYTNNCPCQYLELIECILFNVQVNRCRCGSFNFKGKRVYLDLHASTYTPQYTDLLKDTLDTEGAMVEICFSREIDCITTDSRGCNSANSAGKQDLLTSGQLTASSTIKHSGTTNIYKVAQKQNMQVITLDSIQKRLKKARKISFHTTACSVYKLRSLFWKVEDLSRCYKPMFCQLKKWSSLLIPEHTSRQLHCQEVKCMGKPPGGLL